MKQILIAGVIIAALTIEAVESLNCVQCSWTNSCTAASSSCSPDVQNSCISSFVNFTLGETNNSYSERSCSGDQCDAEGKMLVNFTVQVSDKDYVQFASHCCKTEGCNTKNPEAPSLDRINGTKECPACYGFNESSCRVNTTQKCNAEGTCVDLLAEYINGSTTETLWLKGCAKIDNSTCQFLSAGNKTVGGVIFRKFLCPQNDPTPVPPTNQTTTTPNASSKVSFTPLALASLLLLGLLL
ncbi:ly6/PLAUR domain-containing protein 8 [Dasypus novemcinctus]|uniref:ly6/PLAUR domain-containing protein 8 n=1 Tax=Dasypus novemcinctus TaxID=9361 RepID=UPI000328B45E|nr:ly6/PLAUR domain-containing protein 8 [Dasypus novemcinctus]